MGVSVVGLTVKERILLHLFEYLRFASEADVPQEVTQSGIAAVVGIPIQHASQYLRPLVTEGFVEEAVRHVRRGVRRKKAYFLTARGRSKVVTLREAVFQESVPVRSWGGEVRQVPLSRVYHEERRGSSLQVLLQELESTRMISEVPVDIPAALVDFTAEATAVGSFYGREQELKRIRESLGRIPLVVVTGIAGIGKTTLGSRVCEFERGRRSLFWRRIRRWDTAMDLMSRVASFLKAMGRTGLHEYLPAPDPKELNRVEGTLSSDLAGANALIVFDDVHDASPDALSFLSLLRGVLRDRRGSTMILLSRTTPLLYNRRDVVVEETVLELTLGGLDPQTSRQLLEDAGVAEERVSGLVKASGGSPLFLRMMAAAQTGAAFKKGWNTVATYITEEIEPTLDDTQRDCLEVASLYDVPVPADALLIGGKGGIRDLVTLRRNGLLIESKTGMYVLHDLLREYFRQALPEERRFHVSEKVIGWLVNEAESAHRTGRSYDAISLLENAVGIDVDPRRRLVTLRRLGNFRTHVGDYVGSVETLRTALKDATTPENKADFHMLLANSLRQMWRLDEAMKEIEAGLALLSPGPSPLAAWLLWHRSAIWSDHARSRADLRTLRDWLPRLPNDPYFEGWLAYWEGHDYFTDPNQPDLVRAEACFREALARLESSREGGGPGGCYRWLGSIELLKGNIGEAVSMINRALEIDKFSGSSEYSLALTVKARILVEFLGRYEEAEALYNEAYMLFRTKHQAERLLWLHRHYADLYRWHGQPERALESLRYFFSVADGQLSPEGEFENLALAVRISAQIGELERAREFLRKAEKSVGRLDPGKTVFHLEWARAAVAELQGDQEAADLAFQRALQAEIPRRHGTVMQEVLASGGVRAELLLDEGRYLVRIGKFDRGGAVLREALEHAQRDHRQPLIDAVSQELELAKAAA